ncbi:MAG: type VI secretion system baseplate subunit TssK [Pirellulaceae bacterium]
MRNSAVHWYEGLFLRPQHLQAADRYWSEAAATAGQWDNPYNYGLHHIEFSKEALANYQFELHALQARMRDGTLIDVGGDDLDRIDVKDAFRHKAPEAADLHAAFESAAVVQVFVAIPKLQLGRPNVSAPQDGAQTRYLERDLPVYDETRGGNEQDIQFRRLNVKLLLSTDDTSGYHLIPIAQIKRASAGEAVPQFDESFIPPALSIDAWPGLGRDIVHSLYDVIGQKIELLSQQVINRGIGLDTRDPGDAERILMLGQLNLAYGRLGVLAFAQGVHPLVAYTELCGVLGQLSIFGALRRIEEVRRYDHDDLHGIFTDVRMRIEALINAVRAYEYEQRFFVGVGMGMQVSLEPMWFNSDWQWFIGVNKGDLSQQECRDLLSAGQLDWKFGSSRQVEFLFKQRAAGLMLRPVDRPIRALPSRPDWMFFEVPKQDSPAWRDVQETQTLAMRLKDSLIVNRDRLQGRQELVVSALGRKVPLQFALFAVPEGR